MRPSPAFWLVLAGLVLLAAEAAARRAGFGDPPLAIRDPAVEYLPLPSRRAVRFGHVVDINRYGMRSDDVAREALPAFERVLLVGDSVVYGGHRIDQRDTPAAQLQRRLRAAPGGAQRVVDALAASSWGPENERAALRRLGGWPAANAFVVQSTHDRLDTIDAGDLPPYRFAAPMGALHDVLLAVVDDLRRRAAVARALPLTEPVRADRQARSDAALADLLDELARGGSEVVLVFHPTAAELADANQPTTEPALAALAQAHGARFVSLRAAYARAQASGTGVYDDDIHLTAAGCAVLAQALASSLREPPG